jgi:hypothetical protein
MLRIQKYEETGIAVFVLSGQVEDRHLPELKELILADTNLTQKKLDLTEVKLVDMEVIEFLGGCEAEGIELRNCPPYVRIWIDSRRDIGHEA